ncbi:MAG: Bug family tripartite tricarboxylate transporter substrate binding protein [Candidatus Methylomirabilales bacterium]
MRYRKSPQLKWVGLILALLAFAVAQPALAEYPERPIRLVVPWAPGGDTDAIMRIFAAYMSDALGQWVQVVNIKGGSGTVGAREAKNAKPDGYTLFSGHESIITTFMAGISDFHWDVYEPICLVTSTPSVIAAYPGTPYRTFQDVLKAAKEKPNTIKFGATIGSTSQFFPLMVQHATGIKFRFVSYEGTAPRMRALVGGHIDLAETNIPGGKDYMEAKKLRLLAIATDKRSKELPGVPTLKELGVNVTYSVNRGWFAPKGTPEPILAKLEQACEQVTKAEKLSKKYKKYRKFRKAMRAFGTGVRFLNRKEYAEYLRNTTSQTEKVAKLMGVYNPKKK